ncbi:Protocadherin alpha-C2 [Lemmus lemmus]
MEFFWGCGQESRRLLFSFLLLTIWKGGNSQLHYSVPEEAKHGTFVGRIAQDLGLGPGLPPAHKGGGGRGGGGEWKVASKDRGDLLEVNLQNGILFVNSRIDREALCGRSAECSIHLEVIVDRPLQVFHVEVEVRDINDNPPVFPETKKSILVAESRPPETRFPLDGASDADIGVNSALTYRLDPSDYFALDTQNNRERTSSLSLVLKKSLDREEIKEHRLLLTASDGGKPELTGTVQLLITVLDVNDNTPEFDRFIYKVRVLENARNGTLVINLNATDPDEGTNGDIIYSFRRPVSPAVGYAFYIDPSSGEVRTKGQLDYEENKLYEIPVEAVDKGNIPMTGHCTLLVDVLDVNDNAPEVTITSLSLPVREDAQPSTVIALVSVSDRDSGDNGRVTCIISGGGGGSGIAAENRGPWSAWRRVEEGFGNSYTLVVSGPLDRERVAAYNITVTATDGGIPPLTSQKTLQIEISDINDNPPSFLKDSYSIYIQENNLPGVLLCTVQATDPDQKENAEVTYSLLDREIQGLPVTSYVSINSASGSLYAVNSFDYEKFREFFVTVEAQDKGRPPLSSTVTANVYVVDVNDHAPHILYPTSTNSSAAIEMVPRTAPAGYLVTKVIAMDSDSGQNAWLFYHLVPTSDSDLFKVELHTGEIRITRKIGDESGTTFNLTVVVRDNGEPPLSATVAITVAVVDRVSKMLPDTQRHIKSARTYSEITLYLIIALSTVSFIFLLTIIVLSIIKCYRYTAYGTACCGGFCGVRERCPAELYKQANNNIDARIPHGLKVQPHFIEVRGNGSLTKTYCYKACLTAGSGSDTFMFYNTGAQTGPGPGGAQASVTDNRHLTGQSGQSAGNLIILKNEAVSQNEVR